LRDGINEPALFAVARDNHHAVLAALQDGLEAIQPEVALRALLAVAANARVFEQGGDVLGERDACLVGHRWQFGSIKLADIQLVLAPRRPGAEREPEGNAC
jgi:hypothetical protein